MSRLRTLFSLLAAALLLIVATPSFAQDPADAAADEAAPEGDEAAAGDGAAAPDDDAPSDDAPSDDAPSDDATADDATAAGDDEEMSDEEIEEAGAVPSPWTLGLILSVSALTVGGGSAILGIWVDRDKSRPVSFAYAMSFLIGCAVVVGVAQGYLDEVGAIQQEQDMERMLDMTYEIAAASGDPELIALVEAQTGEKVEVVEAAEEPADGGSDTGLAGEGAGAAGDEAAGEAGAAPTDEDVLAGEGEGDDSTPDGSAD